MKNLILAFILLLSTSFNLLAEDKFKVGVVTILSGDLAVLGDNAVKTLETFKRYYLKSPIEFIVEDARLTSADGLKSYQKLINIDKVDLILAACTSNATMAARQLINQSKVPVISISTGGENIDNAGDYVFRIGNSDFLNGVQQAEYFLGKSLMKVALLTEETEYTQDISKAFKDNFTGNSGTLVFEDNFLPENVDYRTFVTAIRASNPDAIFMPTQTGSALGLFIKQWYLTGGKQLPIYTSFVAAPNKNAHEIAGRLIDGVGYMDPVYAPDSDVYKTFIEHFLKANKGELPGVPFHAAGIIDTLNIYQEYLNSKSIDKISFAEYLSGLKNYQGLMGKFSLDSKGNSDLGFRPAVIRLEMK